MQLSCGLTHIPLLRELTVVETDRSKRGREPEVRVEVVGSPPRLGSSHAIIRADVQTDNMPGCRLPSR